MNRRRMQLADVMKDRGLTHVIVSPGPSFSYLTGMLAHSSERLTLFGMTVQGTSSILLPLLELDGVDATAFDSVHSYTDEDGPGVALQAMLTDLHTAPSSVIGLEELHLRVFEQKQLREQLPVHSFVSADSALMAVRLRKDEEEISAIRRATHIVDTALDRLIPRLRVGMTEFAVAAELEYEMRRLGSAGLPFGTIVGSGHRGALPHGAPSDKVIAAGELVVLDYGAIVDGYAADTTRTIAFGEPDAKAREVYETVRKAQEAALQAIAPGRRVSSVDQAARSVIAEAGYGKYFTHRTGHGLGLECHEYPSIAGNSDLTLVPGMVFTVEPGVYLPGEFGVRIEDDVVVTDTGVEILTKFPKQLIMI